VPADHLGGWTQIFGGKASEPETSRAVVKRNFTYEPASRNPVEGDFIGMS